LKLNDDVDVKSQSGSLTITGTITAAGDLSALGSITIDGGEIEGDITASEIIISKALRFTSSNPQNLECSGSLRSMNTLTKPNSDLTIHGAASVTCNKDVSVQNGMLKISSNANSNIQGNLRANSIDLSNVNLDGGAQTFEAQTIKANQMIKSSNDDITVRVSTKLTLNGFWTTTSQSRMIFDKIDSADDVTFIMKNDLQSKEGEITINYPVVMDSTSDQSISAAEKLKLKDIQKSRGSCKLSGPTGITVEGTKINIPDGDLTIEGSFTSNVLQISSKALTIKGSTILTGTGPQSFECTGFTLGESAQTGGISKSSGDLTVKVSKNIIIHGAVSVPNGAFEMSGETATLHSSTIEASDINFHDFNGGIISLIVEIDATSQTQSFKATNGQLRMDGKLSKDRGILELQGENGIVIVGDISSGIGLIIHSQLESSAAAISCNGDIEFKSKVTLSNSARTEISCGSSQEKMLIFHDSIETSKDLLLLNSFGEVEVHGDIVVKDGSFECSGVSEIYGSVTANQGIAFKNSVSLLGYGDQNLKSGIIQFIEPETGETKVVKSNGNLILGEDSNSNSKLSGVGDMNVFNGSLIINGNFEVDANLYATNDISIGSITLAGIPMQQIIALDGCLTITGRLLKNANDLILGKDCIKLGTETEASGGTILVCGQSAFDPFSDSVKCVDQISGVPGICKFQAFDCPPTPASPTPAPTFSPTPQATDSPVARESLSPTASPTKSSGPNPTPSPIKSSRSASPTPATDQQAVKKEKDEGLPLGGIVAIILVVLAIPGIAILIWLLLKNKNKRTGDREVLLTDDVGEYKAPNA